MNEIQLRLLKKQGAFVLPRTIEHETYVDLLEALLLRYDEPVALYCRGDGGDTRSAFAMVDLIQRHGNVTGLMVGETISAHGYLWAACARRFVSPHGALGLHQTASYIQTPVDQLYARLLALEQESTDRQIAALYAKISGDPLDEWIDRLALVGSSGALFMRAPELIQRGMAQPIVVAPPG